MAACVSRISARPARWKQEIAQTFDVSPNRGQFLEFAFRTDLVTIHRKTLSDDSVYASHGWH